MFAKLDIMLYGNHTNPYGMACLNNITIVSFYRRHRNHV